MGCPGNVRLSQPSLTPESLLVSHPGFLYIRLLLRLVVSQKNVDDGRPGGRDPLVKEGKLSLLRSRAGRPSPDLQTPRTSRPDPGRW